MQLLVTGAGGLLGSNVAKTAANAGVSGVATYRNRHPKVDMACEHFDITDVDRYEDLIATYNPDTVINCAAMTDVDECEKRPGQARLINGETPGRLAQIAEAHGVGFVQISTDYVFDGRSDVRYEPDDETNPIQEYGRSKLLGETSVKNNHSNPWIVRLSFVYGQDGRGNMKGFPAWVLDRLEKREMTPLFTDQFITPTRAGSAAETILDLCRTDAGGTVHVTERDCVTPYEFGTILAKFAERPTELISKSQMADVDRAAARPKNTCLSVDRTESILGRPQPALEADLRALFQSIR